MIGGDTEDIGAGKIVAAAQEVRLKLHVLFLCEKSEQLLARVLHL